MVEVYFAGFDTLDNSQLWETDGTVDGTTELTAGEGPADGLGPSSIGQVGQQILFNGQDGMSGFSLYSYNVTTGSTTMLAPAGAAADTTIRDGFNPTDLTSFNGLLYFEGASSDGFQELWKSDGTNIGTTSLGTIAGGAYSPDDLTVFAGQLYFSAYTTLDDPVLWRSDGTAGGTFQVALTGASASGVTPTHLTPFGADLLFAGVDASGTKDVFSYDGTTLTDLTSGLTGSASNGLNPTNGSPTGGSNELAFAVLGSLALFAGEDASGAEQIYETDGTPSGTHEITGIVRENSGGFGRLQLTTVGNRVLFGGEDSAGLIGLWSTDGLAGDTVEITVSGADASLGIDPGNIVAISQTLAVFSGIDANGISALWTTDGTAPNTREIDSTGDLSPHDFVPVPAVACFAAGTRILTERGEIAVEALLIGDRTITAAGNSRPIRWIGHRSYDGGLIAGNPPILPIMIRADALGDGVPRVDLYVSAKHAMLLDGALIPAELLVNGKSVVQIGCVEEITYFHVELDDHDILLAEGAPSESFVDCNSRGMFQNAHQFAALYPCGLGESWRFCAERIEDGPSLEAIRRRIAARAGLSGYHVEDATTPGIMDGRIDVAAHGMLAGWAFDPGRPHTRLAVEIVVDGVMVATVIANQYRADLAAAGKGSGRCAFSHRFAAPLAGAKDHRLTVRVAGADALAEHRLLADPEAPSRSAPQLRQGQKPLEQVT